MNEEQYSQQLLEITKYVQNKLAALQDSLSEEEIIKFNPMISFFFVNLIAGSVGKEDLISYFLQLLRMADNFVNNPEEAKKRQLDRYHRLKEENKNDNL